MRLTVAEIRLIIVGTIYLVSLLFAKMVLGGYENETVYVVTGAIIIYLIIEVVLKKRKEKR